MILKERRNELAVKARNLAEQAKSAGRDLTPSEVSTVNEAIEEIKGLDIQIKASDDAAEMLRTIGGDGGQSKAGDGTKRLNLQSKALVKAMQQGVQSKGLAAGGEVSIGNPLLTWQPVHMGLTSTTLSFLDLLPVAERNNATYSYLRQVTRTNNAAPVAAGALKPTSVYQLESVDNKLSVIAHLSEPMNIFDLEDNQNLQTFLGLEMAYGLMVALENQVVNGTGTAPNLRGLLNTVGIQVHTASTAEKIITLRGAMTKLDTAGYPAAQFIVHPNDWLEISTKRNSSGNFDLGGAVDSETRKAWGVPVSLSTQIPAGTGVLLGKDAVEVAVDKTGAQLKWGHDGNTFGRNQILARFEGRFGLDVFRPLGVVKINFTPPV